MEEDTIAASQASDGLADVSNNGLPVDVPDEDVLKILISTDNHVGYSEKCEVRGNDSLVTFEEVLFQARKNDVDFVLLGLY